MSTDNPSTQNGTKFQTLVRCIEGELKRRNRDLRWTVFESPSTLRIRFASFYQSYRSVKIRKKFMGIGSESPQRGTEFQTLICCIGGEIKKDRFLPWVVGESDWRPICQGHWFVNISRKFMEVENRRPYRSTKIQVLI